MNFQQTWIMIGQSVHVRVCWMVWIVKRTRVRWKCAPHTRHVFTPWRGGGKRRRREESEQGTEWRGKQAGMVMRFLLCSLPPLRSKAPCAACVQSLRHSCLYFWRAAGNGVCSRIPLIGLHRCQGWVWCCNVCSRSRLRGRSGCWQPISPLGRQSFHMMRTLPFES